MHSAAKSLNKKEHNTHINTHSTCCMYIYVHLLYIIFIDLIPVHILNVNQEGLSTSSMLYVYQLVATMPYQQYKTTYY